MTAPTLHFTERGNPPRGAQQSVRVRWAQRIAALGHHDFCPWANRYVYWLKQPIGWFVVAALAAALVGACLTPHGWLACGVLVMVMGLGVAWPWLALRGVEAELSFARRRCHEGEAVAVALTVRNRWLWPVWGLMVERGFFTAGSAAGEETALVALARVPGWSCGTFSFEFRPPRRGVYPHAPPVVTTGFPFGLWSARRTIAVRQPLIAWPLMVPLASQPMLGGERWSAAGSLRDRAGTEGEVIGARPYRQGDSLRRVHWPQTARRDVLIVCELQATARRRVIVALDEAAFPADTPDDAALLDWALRVVGSLCRQLHSHACDVVCRLGTEKLLPSAGPDGLRPVLDRLAQYQPDAGRAVAGRTVSGRDGGKNDDGLLIVVTSGFAPGATRADSPRDRQRRMVVLDREHESPTPEATGHARGRPWLWLHADGDIARQLQRQWEKRCHEDWSHN